MRRLSWYLAIILISSHGVATRGGAVEFAPPKVYSVGTHPQGIVIADFNSDGKPDIAVANRGSNNVSILLGNDDGTFQPAENFDAGNSPSVILLGDFNGDGQLDLALFQTGDPDHATTGSVSVLLGNGGGTFRLQKNTALSEFASIVVVGDFNLDKKVDLIVGEVERSPDYVLTLSFLAGNGDGTFQAPRMFSTFPNLKHALLAADLNDDGKLDLAVGNGSAISILVGKGNGTFLQGVTVALTDGFTPDSMLAADFNSAGKQRLVVKSSLLRRSPGGVGLSSNTDHISLFLNNGNGTFQAEQILATASWVKSGFVGGATGDRLDEPILGEFNGDGKLDLAYRRITFAPFHVPPLPNPTSLEMLLGRADGTISSALITSDPGPGLVAGNLNGDNLSDLVTLGTPNDNVLVLLNTSPTSGADLGIVPSGASPESLGVGSMLTYSAHLHNEGPQDATGVAFTDTLPNTVTFVSAKSSQGSCVQSHGSVTCDIGSLADAADTQVTVVVTPTTTGTITNTMNLSGNESDLALANNSATQIVTVVPVFTLTVAKAGNGSGTIQSTSEVSGSIDCGTTCSATILGGNTVSLMAVPSSTSVFAGWSGGCIGTDPNTCTVSMSSNQSVVATFNPAPDFTLSPATASLNLKRGAQTTDTLTFAAQGGFAGTIALTCSVSGQLPMPACGISPNSVTPGGSATLTVNTASLSAALAPQLFNKTTAVHAALLPMGMIGFVLILFDSKRRRTWALCFLMIVSVLLPVACGGGSQTGPPAQHYRVTVTATSGTLQHSTAIAVTVN
jgi:uncharacterized repeat protein (TIGR01451 family)